MVLLTDWRPPYARVSRNRQETRLGAALVGRKDHSFQRFRRASGNARMRTNFFRPNPLPAERFDTAALPRWYQRDDI